MRSRPRSRFGKRAVAAIALSSATAAVLSGCFVIPGGDAAVGFDGLQSATIQLEAYGRFVDPGTLDALESGGRGTGFFINSSGLAITNNHVVGGAGTIDVWVGGDQTETFGARVLGSSECLDLAVVQVDGSGFPFLGWYEGEIETALEVYSAGFPLGDPEYTLTKGIVSKASLQSENTFASLGQTIEHDARIRGGNSGGPLVDSNARVVGVNYAGINELDYNFAIHRDEVLPVLQDLIDGTPVESLGLNVRALSPDDSGAALGVWVTSVVAGGPGDVAGIEPGDLLVDLAGIQLAKDGTLEEYCEVIRTQGVEATIDVTVYRPAEGTYYEGQFNGREIELTSGGNAGGGDTPEPDPVGSFVTITDDSGSVAVNVPDTWSDTVGAGSTDDAGNPLYALAASPDLEAWQSTWDVPGVYIVASPALAGADVVERVATIAEGLGGACTLDSNGGYDDTYYVGQFEYYTGCGGGDTDFVIIVANDTANSHLLILTAQLVSSADKSTVLEEILGSFYAQF